MSASEPRKPGVRVHFYFGRIGINYHGDRKGLELGKVIRGPKFARIKLTHVVPPSTGHRIMFYWPSGAWWYLDVYFDRRGYFTFFGKLKSWEFRKGEGR